MPVKSRQAKHAAATRAALLRVARKLFTERGYADSATEEVVRRARVTRGALYHHFRDKQDLFKAVVHEEQLKLAASIKEVAARESDPWRALMAGCHAFLDACLDPTVQRIMLIDSPAVLGWEGCREADAMYYLDGVKACIQAAIDERIIPPQPVEALARVILGALNEAAMMIAHAEDEEAARRDVSKVVDKLLGGIRTSSG
ncbi:MAG: TetR/AcrR family transcriptional regulator [Candidatus Binataceae bacterium]